MATAPRLLAEASRPSDFDVEVIASVQAQKKLPEAITNQEQKRKEAEIELARVFARETRNGVIDAEAAFQRYEAWRVADERAAVRIAALMVLKKKVELLVTKLRKENAAAMKAALSKRIDEIQKILDEKSEADSDLKDEMALLLEEIKRADSPPAAASGSVQAAAKRSKKATASKKRAPRKQAAKK